MSFENAVLRNDRLAVCVDMETAALCVTDVCSGKPLLASQAFGLPVRDRFASVTCLEVSDHVDAMGRGRRAVYAIASFDLFRHSDHRVSGHFPPARVVSLTLYEDHPALVFGFGLQMPPWYSMRLTQASILSDAVLFGGQPLENPMTLNGGAGAETTLVEAGATRVACNSLLFTGEVGGQRHSLVCGGLKQAAFAKVAALYDGRINLFAEDPIGVLADPDGLFMAEDTFYVDVLTQDPFEALEVYGQALRVMNAAAPQVYDFPIICGWSVGAVSKLPDVNTTAKLVEEADHAQACGLTKYTPVSLRLEPDKYHFDTEQGWWDDAHFKEHGHLVSPHESLRDWCRDLAKRGAVPYIYMQLGMPSDDFARAHPEYMLFNDASQVDRVASNAPEGRKHRHHQPTVTYDYTDPGFTEHFVGVWRAIRDAGVRGVKVDYPASAWRPEGGFEDRYASTCSAYRRAFALLREGMGRDGLIDERNLGECARPCLDLTAGVVDTQRTWGDSNAFVPEMISRSGLRWYKNRAVFNYYSDTKAVHGLSCEVLQSLITMNFLTSGRLDLSTSFSMFTPEITQIVSRSYPHYREAKSPRPLDAFTGVVDPQVYDLELTPDWHQVCFYNTGEARTLIRTALSGDCVNNAMGLDASAAYHAYEFWTDKYLGRLSGASSLAWELDPSHCAMISVRRALDYPQVISTNRHILQGWVELSGLGWNAEKMRLHGKAAVIGGESLAIVIACNGRKPLSVDSDIGDAELVTHADPDLVVLELRAAGNREVSWSVDYA